MKKQSLSWLLISLMILISCEKENDEIGNDLKLQKFWELTGYFDSNGNQINEPTFSPDTLFYYEVNIKFLWNDYSQRYEIQGQGPFDIFWGEYDFVNENKLQLNTLETTNTKSDYKELNNYDSLFYQTLKDVTHYSIVNNNLKLFYGDDSQYLLFELKAEQYIDTEEYITCNIDGMNWKGDKDYISAYVEYNYDTELFNLNLGGTSQEILSNGLRYDISFSINLPPIKGEFEFNNNGAVINSLGGVLGNCYGRYKDQYDVDTRSTTGVIAITQLSRSYISGYYYFNSAGIGDDNEVNYNITNGEFLIVLNAPSNWFKTYDFEN